ncbi:superoxide dismutase [Diaphorobacter ruginosibacter]|uniref:Superoxide dismutase n=1 Tax=Diaphorobacter ruginosibacter TaxID=1715720 RepID=A0A7G9RVL7_9BURK|nr:superoxide dismutase [Diaphorobacter ruginosibacter]
MVTHALPPLPYAYDALEPHIDARTMEIHYSKHHQAYVNNLNASLQGTPYADMPLQELIAQVESLPPELRMSVRNNGGGHANHSLFWQVMTPRARSAPEGALARAIDRDLGGLDAFKDAFTKAALSRFGSGWAWLCVTPEGVLTVESSANQDNPAMHGIGSGHVPILGLDVWEHAYYLLYQNRRPDYIAAFYNVVDWDEVARRHALAAPQ